jgi:SAM-dependent methyltransferase
MDPAMRRCDIGGMAEARFDRAYYERFYKDPRTRVYEASDVRKLAAFVLAYLDHLDLPVQRVLDLGCGLGYWRDALEDLRPRARYSGVEVSEYLCEEYGWEQGSVADYRGRGSYDLVVCQGVLQYLDDREADRALGNLARLCRGALYLETLTREDWAENCDRTVTDGAVHLRSVRWYRQRLGPHFVAAGGGLFVQKSTGVVLYELERGR